MPPKVVEKRWYLTGTPPPGTPPPEGNAATGVGSASGTSGGKARAITATVLPTLPKDPFVGVSTDPRRFAIMSSANDPRESTSHEGALHVVPFDWLSENIGQRLDHKLGRPG